MSPGSTSGWRVTVRLLHTISSRTMPEYRRYLIELADRVVELRDGHVIGSEAPR